MISLVGIVPLALGSIPPQAFRYGRVWASYSVHYDILQHGLGCRENGRLGQANRKENLVDKVYWAAERWYRSYCNVRREN